MMSSDPSPSIRELASVIGPIISLLPAIPFLKLHYQNLEKEKTEFLKKSAWNLEAKVCISTFATNELKWWLHVIPNAINNINIPQVDFEISTDASESGWGATDGVSPAVIHRILRVFYCKPETDLFASCVNY